mmetsp:Transcript_15150/g.39974  ORF Transcript_15150/g.39974 Transcript_15150/m.39974 type:complete len:84 (-) Transcript_15150:3263-3514(-)
MMWLLDTVPTPADQTLAYHAASEHGCTLLPINDMQVLARLQACTLQACLQMLASNTYGLLQQNRHTEHTHTFLHVPAHTPIPA